jgi:hypothetical protein
MTLRLHWLKKTAGDLCVNVERKKHENVIYRSEMDE